GANVLVSVPSVAVKTRMSGFAPARMLSQDGRAVMSVNLADVRSDRQLATLANLQEAVARLRLHLRCAQQIQFLETLLHDTKPPAVDRLDQLERFARRPGKPLLLFFCSSQQNRASLMIDAARRRVRYRRHEAIGLDLDRRAILLDWPGPAPP